MDVSIVIPSYNAGPQLRRLLFSLAHNRLEPGDSFDVVVVDDGSTDDTKEVVGNLALPYPVTYLHLPRTPASGRAAARNAGIEKASGDVVVMVDADQIVEPHFLASHIGYHRLRTDLVVAGPRGDLGAGSFDDERLAQEFSFAALPEVVGRDDREKVFAEFGENFNNLATCWHHMFSCNVSVRREHLIAVGGFDSGFVGWGLEDSELGYRLRRHGLAFAFQPAAVVYQRGRGVNAEMFEEWRRNLSYFSDKYAGAADVAVQAIICRVFDPEDRSIDWLEGVKRLEFAARALAGRAPEPVAYHLLEVDDSHAAVALSELPVHAAHGDLLVIDDTEHAELAGSVQCTSTPHELVYFHRPSRAERERILARYRSAGVTDAG
jgi:GT2 family glycosyltransferase